MFKEPIFAQCFYFTAVLMKRLKVDIIVNFLTTIMDLKALQFDVFLKFRNLVINQLGKFLLPIYFNMENVYDVYSQGNVFTVCVILYVLMMWCVGCLVICSRPWGGGAGLGCMGNSIPLHFAQLLSKGINECLLAV